LPNREVARKNQSSSLSDISLSHSINRFPIF
jgi:hypothetical protein